ncbi:unnamed protein product [Moneuplotes crassus]|uniref:Kinesin motor domain-containing protein n=1 Tax=Euplotes crassus TaxID=5936 RepID=A0AAD1U512_EUPCR|nr:unnamed protein product [Moneuplotes crassus]
MEQVVVSVCGKHRDHVHYCQSKLTNLLKDMIGGKCKTLMIANIWPELSNLEETISTFKFATRMIKVHNKAIINVNQDPEVLLRKYERDNGFQKCVKSDLYSFTSWKAFRPFKEIPSRKHCCNRCFSIYLLLQGFDASDEACLQEARVSSSRHGDKSRDSFDGGDDDTMAPAELKRRKTLIEEEGVGEEKKILQNSECWMMDDGENSLKDKEESKKITRKKNLRLGFLQGKDPKERDLNLRKMPLKNIEKMKESNRRRYQIKDQSLKRRKKKYKNSKKTCWEEDVIDEEEYNILMQLNEHKKLYRENFDKYKSLKGYTFFIQNNIG